MGQKIEIICREVFPCIGKENEHHSVSPPSTIDATQMKSGSTSSFRHSDIKNSHFYCGDALSFYSSWKKPTIIISDGPYGVGGFPGDPKSPDSLAEIYAPHIEQWARYALPSTTLWFWNTEVGWANVHPILKQFGWDYVSCCFWDKGMSHVAGNVNTRTIRRLPVVSEVCVQYVKKSLFKVGNELVDMKHWLVSEWKRTGLPLRKANEACGVVDAATRKYFTLCDLWYFPPPEAFEKICNYANKYGKPEGAPYFSIDGVRSLSKEEWHLMRAKFHCPIGVTNVWTLNQLRGSERVKKGNKAIHLNQKPLVLIKRTIEMSSDPGDVVWDPFAGLGTVAVGAEELNRICFCSEKDESVYEAAVKRFLSHFEKGIQGKFDF